MALLMLSVDGTGPSWTDAAGQEGKSGEVGVLAWRRRARLHLHEHETTVNLPRK
jgi:hypothetical protein